MKRYTTTLYYIFLICSVSAQKYNFVNWTVEDGLIQSQASIFCQDKFRQLWIGTEGGISRFDGKKFSGFTVQEGLPSNRILSMHGGNTSELWIGTLTELCSFNGKKFTSVYYNDAPLNGVFSLTEYKGNLYALNSSGLYEIKNHKASRIFVSADSLERVSTMYQCNDGSVLAYVKDKGIYVLNNNNNSWNLLNINLKLIGNYVPRKFFISSKGDSILLASSGVFRIRNGILSPYFNENMFKNYNLLSIAEDNNYQIWIGTDNGAFKIEGKRVLHFGEKNGLSDNSINHIYKDAEGNMWFATNGDGIYKFRENTFTYYDKSAGLASTIVMAVTQNEEGKIYIGGYGGGLYCINQHGQIESVNANEPVLVDSKINCLYVDKNNTLLIGTLNDGAFTFSKKTGLQKLHYKNNKNFVIKGVTCFLRDSQNNLLIGSQQGLFLLKSNDSIIQIKLGVNLVTALTRIDLENTLVGTSKGIFTLDKNYNVNPYPQDELAESSVLCLSVREAEIWVGTSDRGVLCWDADLKKMRHYNSSVGLPSNFIYSLDVSEKNKLWIGTGFGISNLLLNDTGGVSSLKNFGRSDGLLGMECNHNSLLRAKDSSLWFGTTKGLFNFRPYSHSEEKNQPFVNLQSVKLFSSEIAENIASDTNANWFKVPCYLKLKSNQNHLTFEFSAIYFTNPEDLLFKYKLEGIDKDFTISNNPIIIYPALPPGKYTLKLLAITKSGLRSVNEVNYNFEIKKAFYQTSFFQLLLIVLLVGSGALITYLISKQKQKRKQHEKELHEKIREEEFMKLRQRTAEDFHDEMGNSLTRISVLTDVLKSKINGKEQELARIVHQIKENTSALYNGSRDIIWSLNSQNDRLFEILEHLKDIGSELFQDTAIDFNFHHSISSNNTLKLKLDYSRNLTMIFKEAYNNILKHAGASQVSVTVDLRDNNELTININDNGTGFSLESTKSGNGLRNMSARAKRMNGQFAVGAARENGTEIILTFNNIFV